jgi:hypothetical protein
MNSALPLHLRQVTQHKQAAVGLLILVAGMVASVAFAEVPQPRSMRHLQSGTLEEHLPKVSKLDWPAAQASDADVELARSANVACANAPCARPAN